MDRGRGSKRMTRLLSAKQVSERLGIAESTVYELWRKRALPCTRIGRRRMLADGVLNQWIEQNTDWPDPSSTTSRHGSGTSYTAIEAANIASLHVKRIGAQQNDF